MVIDELLRVRLPIREDVLRRWQQELRDQVIPKLDELDSLKAAVGKRKKSDQESST